MSSHTGELPLFDLPGRGARRRSISNAHRAGHVALTVALVAAGIRAADPDATTLPATATEPRSMSAGLVASLQRRNSHNGLYSAEVVATTPLVAGTAQSWTLRVTPRDLRADAPARLEVDVWMPETGERSAVRPTVNYLGAGNYRLDGITLSRPGWWNVALVVSGAAGTDSVAFNVVLPERH
jgi:hypothetical protein